MPANHLLHKQLSNGWSCLVPSGEHLWPLSQIVHKDYCIAVASSRSWQLQNVDAHTIEGFSHRDRDQGCSLRPSYTMTSTYQACMTPTLDFCTHSWPSVVSVELAMYLSSSQVCTKGSLVSFHERSLLSSVGSITLLVLSGSTR